MQILIPIKINFNFNHVKNLKILLRQWVFHVSVRSDEEETKMMFFANHSSRLSSLIHPFIPPPAGFTHTFFSPFTPKKRAVKTEDSEDRAGTILFNSAHKWHKGNKTNQFMCIDKYLFMFLIYQYIMLSYLKGLKTGP